MDRPPAPHHGKAKGVAIARIAVGGIWLAGAVFNLLVTRRMADPYWWLAEGSPVPVYRWFFGDVVGAHPAAWTVVLAAGEATIGTLTLSRGRWARLGLACGALFSALLFSLATPYTLVMGPYALFLAWQARQEHRRSQGDGPRRATPTPQPPHPLSRSPGARHVPATDIMPPLRAAARTAVFFLEVLPMLPSRPVDWVTRRPLVERVRYPTPRGVADGDLYRPAGEGPHPGVVVCLGVVPFGVDHPQVPRLGAALARAGFAALLYWSHAMRDLRLDPEDVDGIALAYRWLTEQPSVDPDRSGLLGTCVGGSFALMAAAQPAIRNRVAFVVAWAPYASMRTLARDIASATTSSGETAWAVDQLTRKVYVRSLTATLEPGEAERLRAACAERDGRVDPGELSAVGQTVYPLLTTLGTDTAEAAVERLPAALQDRLDAMSPTTYLPAIRAPLIVLAHDRDDAVIPIGESRRLVTALAGHVGVRYTEFAMFKHLDPTKVRLPLVALGRELVKFVGSVYPLFRQAVGPRRGEARHPSSRSGVAAMPRHRPNAGTPEASLPPGGLP